MNDFKVGDIVEAFGVRGIIIAEHGKIMTIQLDGVTGTDSFLKDGRAADWHKEPSLKLVERQKETKNALGAADFSTKTFFSAGWDACSTHYTAEVEELRQANERLVKALADIRMIEALYQVGVNIKGESRIGRIAREAIAANPAPRNVVGSKE